MSGTYKLDGSLFTKNPIAKRWQRQQIAVGGTGQGIYSAFWQIELTFSILSLADVTFFENLWLGGGLHTAVLPHPKTGALTGFTGVNIQSFDYSFNDVDGDQWTEDSPSLVLNHISLSATGSV